jgi:hypothetical protein
MCMAEAALRLAPELHCAMMSYAQSYMTTRATLAALLLGGLLLGGLWMREDAREASVDVVQGKVLAAAGTADHASALPTLLIELDDGQRVRLMPGGRLPQAGETVQLQRVVSGQGEQSYRLLDSQ